MRNPKRIKELLDILCKIWELQPDVRFNQLIHNLQMEFATRYDIGFRNAWEREDFFGRISFTPTRYIDLFYLEDDKFLDFLRQKLDELNG